MEIDRRGFLILSGAALLQAGRVMGADSPSPSKSAAPLPWHQKIKRVGQLNFNERDPLELDVTAWADYWADVKADAVLVSVTGILAFYPTAIPYHRRSAYLNGRDLFGECAAAAKQRGIRVIARFSPDLQWEEATQAHPEWFRRAADGAFAAHAEVPGLFNTCMFSTYFTEQMPAIMREINSRYEIDGIFTNAWPPLDNLPACHCDACRNAPALQTQAFYDRQLQRTIELWKLYDAIAKEKNPANLFLGNLGSGIHAQLNLKPLGEICQWFNCDNQGRGGDDTPAWACAQQGRVARSIMKGRTITNVTGAWSTGKVRWRNLAKSPAEATLWMAQTAASGMTIWYHWLGGQSGLGEDHRWQATGRQFLQWMARHDSHFTYQQSLANIGVVWAQRPNAFYKPAGPPSPAGYGEHIQGLYYALLEGRFLFDFVHEDDLTPETLNKYTTLILPNVALLSDEQCAQLKAYVQSGGSLLTTFETSLYDSTGRRRGDFGLGDLLGIQKAGEIQGPIGNSYYARIERRHDILDGFGDTHLLPGAEYRIPVKAAAGADPVLSVIPAYTGYPPERVYSPTPHTTEPAVVITEQGRGRMIHFPGDVDRSAWRSGNADLAELLQNSIRWLARDTSPVTVEGDGVVELFAWQTDPGYALHIVNYTNPNLHKGHLRRYYAIGPQRVRMDIPGGVKIAQVQLLRAETGIPFQQTGGRIEFTIPSVIDYEVAAVIRG